MIRRFSPDSLPAAMALLTAILSKPRKPRPPRQPTEIELWNAEVDRKKKEKK